MKGLLPITVFLLLCAIGAQAQTSVCPFPSNQSSALPEDACVQNVVQTDPSEDAAAPNTMWAHPDASRFWISGQSNMILQGHPPFHAKYTGINSLQPYTEYKTSLLNTLFLGFQAGRNTELFLDIESAAGDGISQALGLAGFTDLDVVRNPKLGAKPYVARVMIRQIVPLGKSTVKSARTPFSLATELPARRLEFRVGRFSTADFFDVNSVGSDSHLQFLNWTVDNNGAFDYAADTRGYTWGAIVEFQDRFWGLRFGEMLMPKVANGIDLSWDLRRARAENIEAELRGSLLRGRSGAIRFLSYFNHANMDSYDQAIDNYLAGQTDDPTLTSHPLYSAVKYGFGANAEHEITADLRLFARWGWNEGKHESFAYTEADQTVAFGGDFRGVKWNRKNDKIGVAFVSNGLSAYHAEYLALGGHGFLLGDGALNYGREDIVESYYTAHVWRGAFVSPDIQHINNPGYNRDRGPVWVLSSRLHLDF